MTQHPPLGAEVILRDQSGGFHRATLSYYGDARVTVELAADTDARFQPRDRVLVTWPEPTGLICLPTQLAGHHPDDVLVWTADIVGDPWPEQRRQHERANIPGYVELYRADPASDQTRVDGPVLDLSEAGLRCGLSEPQASMFKPSTPVELRLSLGGADDLRLPGRVLYARSTARADKLLEVVVVFDRPVSQAEELRRHIVLWQLGRDG
ncbi:hypothetical protein BH10ACT8_BH10ACT8_15070 [soil metagenome]|jgi:hypothetical protein